MKSIQAEYKEATKNIAIKKGARQKDWILVCQQCNDDVARICDVTKVEDYTGLFECCDDNNNRT